MIFPHDFFSFGWCGVFKCLFKATSTYVPMSLMKKSY
jgi:hypothetical protein